MPGWLEQLEGALPAPEAAALRAASPADPAAALRYLGDGPEDSFRAGLIALPLDLLRDTTSTLLASNDPAVALRILDLPALRPSLPDLLARAPKKRQVELLPKLAILERPTELAAAAAALARVKPGPALHETLRALAWTGDPALFPLFERLLSAKKTEDRRAGMEGIARGAGKKDLALLRRAIQAELDAQKARSAPKVYDSFETLELALNRLHELGERPKAAYFQSFFELAANGPGEKAVAVLERFERRDLLPLLESALKHKGDDLRGSAIGAVARLGDAAARARLIERFLTSKSALSGETYARAMADNGIVDAIPFLERDRRDDPRPWTLFGEAVARLEYLRYRHGRVSRDHFRGRLAALEAEFNPTPPPGYGPERSRGGFLLTMYATLGDESSFDDLRGRLIRVYGASELELAERAPHPCFIPALRELPPETDHVRLLRLRTRCGDEEARAELRKRLENDRIFGYELADVRHFPAVERLPLWRSAFARLQGCYRLIALEETPGGAPTEDFRPALREIAANAEEVASVRQRAAWWAERPFPDETAPPPIAELRPEDVDALRKKAAKAPAKA